MNGGNELGAAFIGFLITALPILTVWLRARARREEARVELEVRLTAQDVQMREFVLAQAKESETRIQDLSDRLDKALLALKSAEDREHEALRRLGEATVSLTLAEGQIEALMKRVKTLEGKQDQ